MDWIAWCVSAISISLLSYQVTRAFRPTSAALSLSYLIFLWILIVTSLTFVLGQIGQLNVAWMTAVSILFLVIQVAIPGSRRELLLIPARIREGGKRVYSVWKSLPLWLKGLSLFSLLALSARMIVLTLALPPFIWDSLTYHLTNVAHWIQAGRIELFVTPISRIYTPANYEVLATWFSVFISNDLLIELASLPAYLLAGVAVFGIAREFGLSREAAWIGALTAYSLPAWLLTSPGTKNDIHIASYYLLSMYLLIRLNHRSSDTDAANGIGLLTMLIASVSLAVGTKIYIIHLLPGLLVAGLANSQWTLSFKDPWWRLRGWISDVLREKQWLFFLALALIVLSLLLGLYWNVRNYILTGNPFYPYGVAIESQRMLVGAERTAHFSTERLFANLGTLVDKFWDRQARVTPDLSGTTGWGWIAYGLGIPALLWGLLTRREIRRLTLGFSISLLLLFFSDRPSPWNMRYAIWFPALLSISLSFAYDCTLRSQDWTRRITAVLLHTGVVLNIVMTLTLNIVPVSEIQRMLSLPADQRHAGIFHRTVPVEYESVYKYVPEEDVLGYNLHENGFQYPLYRADFSQRIVYIPFSSKDSCDSIADTMESLNTRYLFVAPEHTLDENITRLRQCANEGSVLRERTGGLYVVKRNNQ
jgi:hypothetical protein